MINPLSFINVRRAVMALAAVVAVGGGAKLYHEWSSGRDAIREAKRLRDQVAALQQSARRIGEVLGQTEAATVANNSQAAKVRIIYREAKRTDPTCAEWARQPVGCPIGGQ